ncbi:MAG: SH3 domain-containing protein, partial [Bacilli bacterium]
MRGFRIIALALVVTLASILPSALFNNTSSAATYEYVTTATSLNVREKASNDSKLLATYKKGTKVDYVKSYNSSWAEIRYSGKSAYVHSKYLKKQEVVANDYVYQVTASSLNVRKNTSTSAAIIGKVYKDDIVDVVKSYSSGWYSIRLNGEIGYVSKDYVKRVSVGKVSTVYLTVVTTNAPYSYTLSATAKGTDQPVYEFQVKEGSSWRTVQSYSTNRQAVYKPAKSGVYEVRVNAKSLGSSKAYDKTRSTTFEVPKSESAQTATLKVSEANGSVSLSGSSSGSSRVLYKFSAYDGNRWTVIQDFKNTASTTWKAPKNGTYKFRLFAKDEASSASYDSYVDVTHVVTSVTAPPP